MPVPCLKKNFFPKLPWGPWLRYCLLCFIKNKNKIAIYSFHLLNGHFFFIFCACYQIDIKHARTLLFNLFLLLFVPVTFILVCQWLIYLVSFFLAPCWSLSISKVNSKHCSFPWSHFNFEFGCFFFLLRHNFNILVTELGY